MYIFFFRFTADSTMPDNLIAQNAMNVTIFHWGIHRRVSNITIICLLRQTRNYENYVQDT